jgi:hypothetical protein
MEADKNGKVKLTFEVEINPAAMEILKMDLDLMGKFGSQAMAMWREKMAKGKMWQGGHGMGMMMHHGQEMQNKE